MQHLDFGAYEALTRTEKYEELKRVAPEAARGQSRATAAKLYELYVAACAALPVAEIVPLLTTEELSSLPVVEASGDVESFLTEHVHGPGCGHEMERINPMMPDGIVQLPPDDAAVREFVFKDTNSQDRPLTEKQQGLWVQFLKAFKVFQENPAHSGARRDAKAYAYSLKVAGVLVNKQFYETLERGAAHVREVRKMHRMGVDTSDVKTAAREQT